jgi:tetratricopeptide (TPR) repeat protein
MTLAERLAQIEAAASAPGGMALRTVERLTDGKPNLLRIIESAAVPHAWDAGFLAQVLDADLAASAPKCCERLVALPVVEPYLSRPGWHNVHEVTRLALRDKMHAEGRLPALSARAFAACGVAAPGDSPAQVIERLYHHLLADPNAGAEALEAQWRDWDNRGRWAELNDLAAALEEVLPYLAPAALARALLRRATIRAERRPVPELAAQARKSIELFAKTGPERGLSQALDLLGSLAVAQGDLAGALRSFTQSKTIFERLAASDPANAAWQRDLSVSLNKLGDLAVAQGNGAGALRYFTESKTIRERLAASDPANAAWQRDLSVSLNKLGNLAVAQGDLAGALRSFTQSKTIRERLAASDPANAGWQRDLSVSHVKLYQFAQKKGDAAMARAELQACYTVLHGMKQRGLHFDPQMAKLYESLGGMFGA